MNESVSIVIPCFRQAHYLPMALDSVLSQTHRSIEAIVVNDGSDDDTDAVVAKYHTQVKYVRQKNQGLSAARNAGLNVATSDYLLFLDADDLLHPSCVQLLVTALQGQSHAFAVCGWKGFNDTEGEGDSIDLPAEGDLFPQLIHANIAPVHSFLLPRKLIQALGGFEISLKSCEDWDLWIRLASLNLKYIRVPQLGVYYRKSLGSMSTNVTRMLVARVDVLFRTYRAFLENTNLLDLWGNELATAAIRVRRRLLAQSIRLDLVAKMDEILSTLLRKGFAPVQTGKQAWVSRMIGWCNSEWAIMQYYRWCDKSMFQYYTRGYA